VLKDHNGQISAELILLIGLVLIIVMAFASPLGESLETNQVMAAAKTGILNATNDLAYKNTGNIFRFNNINFTTNNRTMNITAKVYSMKPTSTDEAYIKSQTINTIAETLNKPVSGNYVLGNYYNYTVNIVWVG